MDPYKLPISLNQFALIPRPEERIAELAAMAENEDWDYHNNGSEYPHPVLLNYIRYTYKRIAEEKKVSVSNDEKWCCWNTGLVTPNQEPIYIMFEENLLEDRRSYWHFYKLCRRGDHELSKFSSLPEMAHYFDDPSQLIFDTRKDLRANIDGLAKSHELFQNANRRENRPPYLPCNRFSRPVEG